MQRINTAYFYKLAQKLNPLRGLVPNTKLYFENYNFLYNAQEELRFFLSNPLMPPVTSYSTGKDLLAAVQNLTNETYDEDRLIQWGEPSAITEALNHFEISLQSDFNTRDTFIVSPKSTHSTTLLSEYAENMVSIGVRELVPDTVRDLHEAGRCIAFELPTAGAFHLFRAVEALIRIYGEFVLQRPFSEKEVKGGLGSYSNCLKIKTIADPVDERITGAIDHISKLHRNPTMHPKWHISNTEVLATMGLAVGIMETVALDWNRRKNTPTTPLVEILPDDTKVMALLEEGNEQLTSKSGSARINNEIISIDTETKKAKKFRPANKSTAQKKKAGS